MHSNYNSTPQILVCPTGDVGTGKWQDVTLDTVNLPSLILEGQVVATDDMKQLLNELYRNEHHIKVYIMVYQPFPLSLIGS